MKVAIEPFEKIWGKNFNFKFLGPLFIWRRVTRLAELLGKGEIPAAILKYSLLTWNRRV